MSLMLVQAQASETHAARGSWRGPRLKKSQRNAAGSWREVEEVGGAPERHLREVKIWSEILMPALERAAE